MAQSILSSLLFRSLERFGVKAMGLVVSIVLARLLDPADFGQIAIIMVFINLAQILIDSGLSTALIQSTKTREEDYSTVLYTSLVISGCLIATLYAVTPAIASFYESEALIKPLRVFSFSLLIGALNAVLIAKMQREMLFKKLMCCNLGATLISGALGIYCAFLSMGVWALVIYFFATTLVAALFMLLATGWRPRWCYSLQRASELFSFGWKMMISGLLCGFYHDLRTLIIGKLYAPRDLGYYNRGDQFPSVISNSLDNAVQSVMFPVMSTAQHDPASVRRILKHTLTMSCWVITPLMMVLSAMSEPMIRLLLTEKWLPCVPYMQVLCIGYATLPWTSSNLIALKSIGRSDLYMRLEVFRRGVMLVILLLSIFCFDSLIAIAIGMAVSSWLDYAITTWPIGRLLHYKLREQLIDIRKVVFASVITALLVYCVDLLAWRDWITVLVQGGVAVCVYLLLCRWIRIEAFELFINKMREQMVNKSKVHSK